SKSPRNTRSPAHAEPPAQAANVAAMVRTRPMPAFGIAGVARLPGGKSPRVDRDPVAGSTQDRSAGLAAASRRLDRAHARDRLYAALRPPRRARGAVCAR